MRVGIECEGRQGGKGKMRGKMNLSLISRGHERQFQLSSSSQPYQIYQDNSNGTCGGKLSL